MTNQIRCGELINWHAFSEHAWFVQIYMCFKSETNYMNTFIRSNFSVTGFSVPGFSLTDFYFFVACLKSNL